MLGFWLVLVKLFGPVHAKVVPTSVAPVRFSVCVLQIGLLLEAVAEGVCTTVKIHVAQPVAGPLAFWGVTLQVCAPAPNTPAAYVVPA